MFIANPIYDVVFKYLMEDKEVAILLISEIIGENVIDLEFKPQESVGEIRDPHIFTIYRMDFSAKIQLPNQQFKQVLIEIQKAKFHTDIMRFRNYLGMQYSNKENAILEQSSGKEIKHALPIQSIYFLGHRLDHIEAPIVQVKRAYWDGTTGEPISEREEFIESLTHDSIVIQIPQLRKDMRTDLERLLSVFDQSYVVSHDNHILDIDDEQIPGKFRKVVRRLIKANSEEQVRQNMNVEDEYLEDLQAQERQVLKAKQETAEAKQQAQQADQRAKQADQRAKQADQRAEQEKQIAQQADERAKQADQRAGQADQRAEEEKRRSEQLLELLKKHGINP